MSHTVSRRDLLGTALAAGLLPAAAHAASPEPQRLVAGTRMLEVNGRPARVFGLIGPDGRPGIHLAAGERFRVDLANETGGHTLVHWHGQLPPWTQDGFPWPQTPPIADGTVQAYDYAPIAGTYWMHSHHGMQEQRLMTAPLIVQDEATQREDRQEVVVMLHDFTFRTPDEVLAGLTGTSAEAAHAMAQQARWPATPGAAAPPSGRPVNMAPSAMAAMPMPGTTKPGTPQSKMPQYPNGYAGDGDVRAGAMRMDLNDVQYDAFLANDRTLADPEVVRVEHTGRLRLRIINGASSSQFWIDLGVLTGRVVATDGHAVQPVTGNRFPLAMAQRLDILVDLPAPAHFPSLPNWKVRGGGPALSSPLKAPASCGSPSPHRPPRPSTIRWRRGWPR